MTSPSISPGFAPPELWTHCTNKFSGKVSSLEQESRGLGTPNWALHLFETRLIRPVSLAPLVRGKELQTDGCAAGSFAVLCQICNCHSGFLYRSKTVQDYAWVRTDPVLTGKQAVMSNPWSESVLKRDLSKSCMENKCSFPESQSALRVGNGQLPNKSHSCVF